LLGACTAATVLTGRAGWPLAGEGGGGGKEGGGGGGGWDWEGAREPGKRGGAWVTVNLADPSICSLCWLGCWRIVIGQFEGSPDLFSHFETIF